MNETNLNRRNWLTTVTAATTGAAVTLSSEAAVPARMSANEGQSNRDTLLLAIDDVSLPFRKNLGLYLSKPTVRPEAVLKPSEFGSGAPDDLAAHFYGTRRLFRCEQRHARHRPWSRLRRTMATRFTCSVGRQDSAAVHSSGSAG